MFWSQSYPNSCEFYNKILQGNATVYGHNQPLLGNNINILAV